MTGQKPNRRWRKGKAYKGCVLFNRAITKYGWDNIDNEIIQSGMSRLEACKLEKELIAHHDSDNPINGYNIHGGGHSGYEVSQKTRLKLSKAHKGIPLSKSHRRNISLSLKGRKSSKRQIELMIKTKIKNGTFKFNPKLAKEARIKYQKGDVSKKTLALKYSMSETTMGKIINNEIWFDDTYKNQRDKDMFIRADAIRTDHLINNVKVVDLADKYNTSKKSIYRTINNENFVDPNYTNTRPYEKIKEIEDIRDYYQNTNASVKETAKHFGRKRRSVSDIINNVTNYDPTYTNVKGFLLEEANIILGAKIRKAYAEKNISQQKVADMFNVSQAQVNKVVLNRVWVGGKDDSTGQD